MEIQKIEDIINGNILPQVLLLFGEEDFLLEEAYNKLIKYLLENKVSEFDFELFDGEDASLDRIADSCIAYPFTSEIRLVVVKHFEKLVSGRSKADEKSPFFRLMNNFPPTTILVIRTDESSLNGISASLKKNSEKAKKSMSSAKFPYKVIFEKFSWLEFPKVYESDYSNWVNSRFKAAGKKIAPAAVELLVAQSGNSLWELHNEIDKLLIYAEKNDVITEDNISFVTGISKVNNIFELQKAIGKRDLPNSLKILENMLANERQEMLIMTMLTKYFITLWKLLEESVKTTNQYQLAGAVGINPFFVQEYLAAVRNYTPAELDNAFIYLTDADLELKSSSVSGLLIIQKMLVKIMDKVH